MQRAPKSTVIIFGPRSAELGSTLSKAGLGSDEIHVHDRLDRTLELTRAAPGFLGLVLGVDTSADSSTATDSLVVVWTGCDKIPPTLVAFYRPFEAEILREILSVPCTVRVDRAEDMQDWDRVLHGLLRTPPLEKTDPSAARILYQWWLRVLGRFRHKRKNCVRRVKQLVQSEKFDTLRSHLADFGDDQLASRVLHYRTFLERTQDCLPKNCVAVTELERALHDEEKAFRQLVGSVRSDHLERFLEADRQVNELLDRDWQIEALYREAGS
jgi:hypothetical protein